MGDTTKADKNKQHESGENAPRPSSPLQKPIIRIALFVAAAVLLLGGIVRLLHWWNYGRFVQTTNDAYLDSDQLVVTSKTAGTIEAVYVSDNQEVIEGQALVKIDDSTSRAQFEQAQAQRAQATADISQYRAQILEQESSTAQARAQAAGARMKLQYIANEVERYRPLIESGAEKSEKLAELISNRDQAVATLHQDEAATEQSHRKIATLLAQIQQSDAKVAEAEARERQASVDLDRSLIKASVAGRVADRSARVGAYAQAATRLLTVVPIQSLYLVANFKETQIGLMRAGQPATIKIDALDGHKVAGTVQSFAPGTGAQFAVIPATNATGNFTKIVQRVPVRIQFDAGPEALKVLVPGLSVEVAVDTAGRRDDLSRYKHEDDDSKDERKRRHDLEIERDRQHPAEGAGK